MVSVGKIPGLAKLSFSARLPRNSSSLLNLFRCRTSAKSAEQRLSANQVRVNSQDKVDHVHTSQGSAAVALGPAMLAMIYPRMGFSALLEKTRLGEESRASGAVR